jgi:uncharacterized membrane protein
MRGSPELVVVLAVVALVAPAAATAAAPSAAGPAGEPGAGGAAPTVGAAGVDVPRRGATDPPAGAAGGPAGLPGAGPNLSANSTAIEIAVRPDGSAAWTIQYRVNLDDEATTERFERVDQDVEENPLAYTGPFTEQMQEAADVAAAETGRSMSVGNTTVTARTTAGGYGVVTYRFVWTNFAASSDGQLRIGDALVGFFLASERSSLAVSWPEGYDLEQVSPEPDETSDRSVIWRGPREFAPNQPRVVVSGGLPVPVEGLAAVAVGLVVVAAVWRLRGGGLPVPAPRSSGASADGEASSEADDEVDVPDELLSDRERVLELLERNGGRMKQQDVVDHLDWSETKTSQVVNGLKEDGDVEVYRIGRENVVSLPGEMDV